MLTSRRQGWDLTVIKKAYTTLILLYSACWEKGDSLQNIYKKVISKAKMLPPLFHTIPREGQIVLGTYRPQRGAHRCTRGNSSGATCSGWKREFSYLGCKEPIISGKGEFAVRWHMEIRRKKIIAAWGGVGVVSQEGRNTWVTWLHRKNGLCSPIWPLWGWKATGSPFISRSTLLPDSGSCCFYRSCHNEQMNSPSTLLFAYS